MQRSQGDTVKTDMAVNFSGRAFPHCYYVALSKVDKIEHLHIKHFDPSKIKVSEEVINEMSRMRKVQLSCHMQVLSGFTVAYLNAQSLHRHLGDVEHDHRLQKVDILICSETRFLPTDDNTHVSLSSFSYSYRNDEITSASAKRPYHGMVLYSKQQLNHTPILCNTGPVECMVTQTYLFNHCDITIVSVYVPPDTKLPDILEALDTILDQLTATSTVVLGDFNVDIAQEELSRDAKKLLSFLARKEFKPQIQEWTTDKQTCIDHIFSGFPIDFSYHKAIWFSV